MMENRNLIFTSTTRIIPPPTGIYAYWPILASLRRQNNPYVNPKPHGLPGRPHNSEREKRTSTTPAVTYEHTRLTPILLTSVQRYFSSPRVPTLPSQSQSLEEHASLSLYLNSPPVSLPPLPTPSPSAPSPANQGPSQTVPRCTDGLCAGWEFWAWEGKDFWMFVEPWVLLEPRVCCGGDLLRRENHGRYCRSSGGYPSDSEAFLSACCRWSMDGGC
jgi:hypothetical protein